MSKKITTEIFIERAKKIHGNKYNYRETKYVKMSENVSIICPIHGPFLQTPHNHLNGRGCCKCGILRSKNKQLKSLDAFVRDAKKTHNNVYDYSKVDYINARSKVCIICPKHGEFWQRPDDHIRGKGCPKCGIEHRRKTNLERYGATTYFQSDEGKIRTRAECLRKYGVDHYSKSLDFLIRMFFTKVCNNTFSSSNLQDNLYKRLVLYYGDNDVYQEYIKDERYPFHVDFYIKSQDLFIELNGHWTHNDHWFDENNEMDLNQLKLWTQKSQTSVFYKNAIEVWTKRDVIKRRYASNNNLNYVAFWGDCQKDIDNWFSQNCPIRQDWK